MLFVVDLQPTCEKKSLWRLSLAATMLVQILNRAEVLTYQSGTSRRLKPRTSAEERDLFGTGF